MSFFKTYAELIEAAGELKHLMVARTTGSADIDEKAFRIARKTLMDDARCSKVIPESVRRCRSGDEVWAYVKAQDDLDTYASRREFFRVEFDPLFSTLETPTSAPLDVLVQSETAALSAESVSAAWAKALERRATDPDGAITAARTLIESVCKTILDDGGQVYQPKDDLPKLYRAVSEALSLAPSAQSEEQFKRILGGATTVVEGLGSLRNSDGDAHGKGRRNYRPSPRHAALAVNLAGAMAVFLMQTWEERRA